MKHLALIIIVCTCLLSCKKNSSPDQQIPGLPTLSTASIIAITSTGAKSGGNITSDGGATITERGICFNTTANPTISNNKVGSGGGTGIFNTDLSGLTAKTKYYLRAYAINSTGTAYGNEVSFTTYPLITDIDGNFYDTVTIGTQTWMTENLKTTHFRNGDPIPLVTDQLLWGSLSTAAYCDLENDPANSIIFGRLYNWYAVNDNRKIAPQGWHVPTDAEWTILETYLGGSTVAGGKMKETGSTHWCTPNVGATNESGFSALPGGARTDLIFARNLCYWGLWWSATEKDLTNSFNRILFNNGTEINRVDNDKKFGMSVRCIKD